MYRFVYSNKKCNITFPTPYSSYPVLNFTISSSSNRLLLVNASHPAVLLYRHLHQHPLQYTLPFPSPLVHPSLMKLTYALLSRLLSPAELKLSQLIITYLRGWKKCASVQFTSAVRERR